jgi:hypothetical protein
MDINTELLIEQIKLYYLKSFRTDPEEISDLFVRILDSIARITNLPAKHQTELNPHLLTIMDAMQRKDYVLIRDVLWYEIKPLLENQ